jgi:predicted kinase
LYITAKNSHGFLLVLVGCNGSGKSNFFYGKITLPIYLYFLDKLYVDIAFLIMYPNTWKEPLLQGSSTISLTTVENPNSGGA